MSEAQVPMLPLPVEPQENAPVREVSPMALQALGDQLKRAFDTYKNDRRIAELKWMRNLRQYLGLYDPEIVAKLGPDRSQAYPRLTRVKCISTVARVMNLMFPGNERNWDLTASPSAEMAPQDVMAAIQQLQQKDALEGRQTQMTEELVQEAVNALAAERALGLRTLIDDQLQELGGNQTLDYIALNRKVVRSGVMYGIGVLKGPMVRVHRTTSWGVGLNGLPMPQVHERYKPMFEFLPVWDYYPDMSAKDLRLGADGWFERIVMTRSQVRELANRPDFFSNIIKLFLARNPQGNYKAMSYEQELRTLGVSINVNDQRAESNKYEIIVWHGPVSGQMLRDAGADVPDDKIADDIDAEVWMLGDSVIKADINAWRKIGAHDVKTAHVFVFDEDDSSPVGNGLPSVIRDSQMSVSAATRMLLDNASVVCGPNMEVNLGLLIPQQDIKSIHAYKIWYREDEGPSAQYPAVRNVPIDGHLNELLSTIKLFMDFADMESFVNPANGGDVQRGQGEPMRTAAGASMLRGDAALPFKDIIRNFDTFTQSVIASLITFNRKFNPGEALEGDYNVVARGATSLIAKEIRGVQVDTLVATLTPEERDHVDERKLVEQRFAVRDMQDVLVPKAEAEQRRQARSQQMQEQQEQMRELAQAEVRKTLADAFKSITQGQKNAAAADAQAVNAALAVLEDGSEGDSSDDTKK
jgi:hypothetical protein